MSTVIQVVGNDPAGYEMIHPKRQTSRSGVVLEWKDINYTVGKKLDDGSTETRTILSKCSGNISSRFKTILVCYY